MGEKDNESGTINIKFGFVCTGRNSSPKYVFGVQDRHIQGAGAMEK